MKITFSAFTFNVPIFSTLSWPSTLFNIPQAKGFWFYSPQKINSLSSDVIGMRQQSSCVQWVRGSGSPFLLKHTFSTTVFALFLHSFPEGTSATIFQVYNANQVVLQFSVSFQLPEFFLLWSPLPIFLPLCIYDCFLYGHIHLLSFCRVQE